MLLFAAPGFANAHILVLRSDFISDFIVIQPIHCILEVKLLILVPMTRVHVYVTAIRVQV